MVPMIFKKNFAFIAILAVLVVAFVASLVWLHRQASQLHKHKDEIESKQANLEQLGRKNPASEHLAAVKAQYEKAEAEYARLNSRLLTWWDKEIYDLEKSPRQPVLFLGDLQQLRTRIRTFADNENVLLGTGVENLGFPELAQDTPPAEVTFEMLKQRSVIQDILMLLIQNKVESIDSITWRGPGAGGKLYKKYLVSVSFTCKYPSLAKFQTDLVNKVKVPVDPYGDFPRNYLVIEGLSYVTEDRKVASLASAGSTGSGTTRTGPGRTSPGRTSSIRLVPGRILPGRSPSRPPSGSAPGRTPTRTGTGTMRQPTTGAREKEKPSVGREPNYNILTVTMTIAMVDFAEEVTGPVPALEEEKNTSRAKGKTRTAANPPGR